MSRGRGRSAEHPEPTAGPAVPLPAEAPAREHPQEVPRTPSPGNERVPG